MSELFAQTDRLRAFAGIHDRIATDLSLASAPETAGIQASHGQIAATVGSALSTALDARLGTMHSAADAGSTISALLREAARRYEQGDRDGAEKLRAAAEELAGQRVPPDVAANGSGATAATGEDVAATGTGSPANNQMVGQVLGQIGQQVGALAGAVTAPLLGLAQGLQQVPQQIMQGAAQAAQGAATSTADDRERLDRRPEDTPERSDEDEDSPEPTPRAEPDADAASPEAASPGVGRTSAPPVVAEPPRPAQTRPQAR